MPQAFMMAPGTTGVIVGLLAFVAAACGALSDTARDDSGAPDTVVISAGETCPACTLSLDTLGPTIGGPGDPVGVTVRAVGKLDLDRAGEIWLALGNVDPGRIVRYDTSGRAVEFARPGEGPGEFRRIGGLEAEGDSVLWVWGDRYVRLVRHSGGEFLSETRNRIPMGVSAMVGLGGRRFVLVGWSVTPGRVNCFSCPETAGDPLYPLWIASFDSDGGLLSRRRVVDLYVIPADNAHAWAWGSIPVTASGDANGFWSAAPDRIEVTQRDSTGATRRVFSAAAPWFPEWDPRTDLVDARVVWMDEDEEGRLWLVLDGDRTAFWRESGLPKVPWGTPPEPRPDTPRLQDRISAVVAIDPHEEVIVLERVLPVRLLGRNGGPLTVVSELPSGHQTITPVRLAITSGR